MKLLLCFVLFAFSSLFCSSQTTGSPDSGTLGDGNECKVFPEVVLLLDVTHSYADDLVNLKQLMPDVMTYFANHFGGHAKFGITTFRDKGIEPFGWVSDYCFAVHLPLTSFNSKENVKAAQDVFNKLRSNAGYDYLDGANEAMFRAAVSNGVGWSSETHDADTGRPILRILALLTDAAVHDPEYYNGVFELNLPPHDFLTNEEEFKKLQDDPNYRCNSTDYPSPASIKEVLNRRSIMPVVLSGRPAIYDEAKKEWVIWTQYRSLLERYNKEQTDMANVDIGLKKYYEWYMGEQVGVAPIVELIDEKSETFIKVFQDAIGRVEDLKCLSRREKKEEI